MIPLTYLPTDPSIHPKHPNRHHHKWTDTANATTIALIYLLGTNYKPKTKISSLHMQLLE